MRPTKTSEQFIQDAKEKHGELYDYSQVNYINNATKVSIACLKHGVWRQTPNAHLKGKGCPKCADKTKTTEQFIQDAKEVHGELYDYRQVNYVNCRQKVSITCPKHGTWKQKPGNHLAGRGCPKCTSRTSKSEVQWLDSLGIPEEFRQYKIKIGKKTYKVDGYDPVTNTVYEFHGDFWHGNLNLYDPNQKNPLNKKTFLQLFKETTKRARTIKTKYNLVSIWESDWKTQQDNTKNSQLPAA